MEDRYDSAFIKTTYDETAEVKAIDIQQGRLPAKDGARALRVHYTDADSYIAAARALGIMPDFKVRNNYSNPLLNTAQPIPDLPICLRHN